MKITTNYENNIKLIGEKLGLGISYDIIEKKVEIDNVKLSFFCIDGLFKDDALINLINTLSIYENKQLSSAKSAKEICEKVIAAVEVSEEDNLDNIIKAILSGITALVIDGIEKIILIDFRTYPTRSMEEPDVEKVLRGARDGFVETIVFNSALIRRRIRDPNLLFEMTSVGKESKTDVAISYMDNKVNKKALAQIKTHLSNLNLDALTLGDQSLIEALNKKYWYNPMPKVRYTERADVTAAHLMEGSIALLVDNNPSAMLLPTSIFDFLQDIDDYYNPILTGNYLRLLRNFILLITLFLSPLYLLAVENPNNVPLFLKFILPTENYSVPLLLQFLILELSIDGLRIASINTPSSLGMSLSVVGALILGEYSVSTGWFIPQTILYMSTIGLASFTQKSLDLSYGIKFFRIFLLIATSIFKLWGLIIATTICFIIIATTKTLTGEPYLYPLIPFNWKELSHVLFRTAIKTKNEK